MRSRWLLNLVLLLLVGGIIVFLNVRPAPKQESGPKQFPLSTVSPDSIARIGVEFPAKAAVRLEKREQRWFLAEPYAARAGDAPVAQILSILSAVSSEKFPASDLGRFGLDQPVFRLRLDNEEFSFGTTNPLDGRQYVAYRDSVYLLPSMYAEAATIQVVELLDKRPLAVDEEIAGFEFSRLEQWEPTGLKLSQAQGKWNVSIPQAKPVQEELNTWLDEEWKPLAATSVEPRTPDARSTRPTFDVKLKNGKSVRFEKVLESPELQLLRLDEGLLYHFPQDTGFVILNPPIGFKPQ